MFMFLTFFLFKQKTAYEMRISDWSSDVCSSDLLAGKLVFARRVLGKGAHGFPWRVGVLEPVHHHRVDDAVMADARARAVLRQRIRRVRHRLHAACQDRTSTRLNSSH